MRHLKTRCTVKQALPHHRVALEASPQNPVYRRSFRSNLVTQADCYAGLADHARVAAAAEALARADWNPVNDAYDAAGCLCDCVTLADKDKQLPEPRRKELTQSYADRALTLLRQAIAHGLRDAAHLKKDPRLEPLQGRDEFQKLLGDLERQSKE
jgi:hypothetical protein